MGRKHEEMPQEPQLSPEEMQQKLLDDAFNVVKQCAYFMKKGLDENNLRDALKQSANMLGELRTSKLSPTNYYQLFISITQELRYLEDYFYEEWKNGRKMVELYELVQYAGNILPRLYLLCTVGSVYIKSKEAPAKDILKDLVEMCRGVQHPQRGLFLRNYLAQVTKDKLPDLGSEFEGAGGSVNDSIDFILQNYGEMTKLWVRMQHQSGVRDREKREQERIQLKVLIGFSLNRLSNLEGLDMQTYKQAVLPQLLEQIIASKDEIAQHYLMEVIVQVFPDEFHINTLETFLQACSQLHSAVNVNSIIISMMDRLANFARSNPEGIPEGVNVFQMFIDFIQKFSGASSNDVQGVLELQAALMSTAISMYPDNLDYIDSTMGVAVEALGKHAVERKLSEEKNVRLVTKMLTLPMEHKADVLSVLELSHYPTLMSYLQYDPRKRVAWSIVESLVKNKVKVETLDHVEKIFQFILPLVKDQEDQPEEDALDMDEFETEQEKVAAIVHLFHADTVGGLFKMLLTARRHFGQGGTLRIKHTLPPVIFRMLAIGRQTKAMEDNGESANISSKKVFQVIHETVTALSTTEPLLSLQMFLQCAQAANAANFENAAYEFLTQAFILYEDNISDSKQQVQVIALFVGTLVTLTNFTKENYDTLITKTTQYAAKLLRKSDQCTAICQCSHLFWVPGFHEDAQRVLECLQRALKTADRCVNESPAKLFVEILNHCVFFFEKENPNISAKYISNFIALIDEQISSMDTEKDSDEAAEISKAYHETIAYIKQKSATEERYKEIAV